MKKDLFNELSNLIEKRAETSSGFKEKFLSMKPGPDREKLIYEYAIKQGKPKDLVPIQVKVPGGTIIYKVMKDYLMIDGIRVPMTPITAQKIMDHYGMTLPTTKMSKQIWQAADAKIPPRPMTSGNQMIGGKQYTAEQVAGTKIGDSDTSVAFNQKLEEEINKNPNAKLYAGHMKDMVLPDDPNRFGMTGWYDPKTGEAIQKGNISKHDIKQHSEYATGIRLVDSNAQFIPDENKSAAYNFHLTEDALKNKKPGQMQEISKALTHTPGVAHKYVDPNESKKSDTKQPQEETKQPEVKQPEETKKPEAPKQEQSGFYATLQNILDKAKSYF